MTAIFAGAAGVGQIRFSPRDPLPMTPLHAEALLVHHRQEMVAVSESRPTLDEIAVVFAHLADRVAAERARSLDPVIRLSIARAITELRRHIPGLYTPPDAGAAAALASASADALRRGRLRAALARATGH